MTPLEAALAALPPPDTEKDRWRHAALTALITGYDARYANDHPYTTLAVEETFDVPLRNPATGRPSRRFRLAGKIDAKVEDADGLWLVDHKTTSENLGAEGYWQHLAINGQISTYCLAALAQGLKPVGMLWDVIRKPCIRPKDGEPPWAFRERLTADALERPDFYFHRRLVRRPEHELLTYAEELWELQQEIHDDEPNTLPRRCPTACYSFGRYCGFLDLCATGRHPDSHPHRSPCLHPELGPGFGAGHLTHSRASTFAQCPRKHYYRYSWGLTEGGDAEALVFGEWAHLALGAWWAVRGGPGAGRLGERQDDLAPPPGPGHDAPHPDRAEGPALACPDLAVP
jgi:hypothetical protein